MVGRIKAFQGMTRGQIDDVEFRFPAASADDGISHDFLVYGADGNSYIVDSVFFSNRSASVDATFHAAGCRRFYVYALAGTNVKVSLTDQNGHNARTGDIYR